MNDLYALLTYILVVTFTPGPNNIMSMVNGMRNGYKKILPFLLGITSGFLIVMVCCAILNMVLVNTIPTSGKWLKYLGAAYMLYLAYHVFRSGPIEDGDEGDAINTFGFGFSMQFMNIKGILYGVSVFSLFITDFYQSPPIVLLFAIILALIAFTAISTWAIGGSLIRNFARKHYRVINVIMGGLLVYTAIASLF